ncbi:GNAT family N-acetyltransferase [Kitasatospora sp. NPDC094019]|uniref:GNAT family N-acetyltransferase n=1 Tax=Kitasatospora sp. NPDC094019 TaxID=3364091 RepID=UPI00381EDE0F
MTLVFGSSQVRYAADGDAEALYELSRPFMDSGELRRRDIADYRSAGDRFLLVDGPDGPEGCLALRVLETEEGWQPVPGLLHNFCVRDGRHGLGLGARLLEAQLLEASRAGLRHLFTASTGTGALFRRHGFVEVPPTLAPRAWASGLDPTRGSRVYLRRSTGPGARPGLPTRDVS